MAKILIGITGSIAAIKTLSLIHIFANNGHECKVIVTPDGLNFVTPISITSMGAEVFTDNLASNPAKVMEHINLAKWADYILIVPASANSIAKLACGIADNLLLSTILASEVKPILVPAMNQQMWKNHFTQKNITALLDAGIDIWGPKVGLQACGDNDIGRMLEPDEIYARFNRLIGEEYNRDIKHSHEEHDSNYFLSGSAIVITAGATREPIDPVRYISNHSSGKMGYALALQAVKLGARVILISGATNLLPPAGLDKFIVVETAEEMLSQVEANILHADIFISCAAVCDYKVSHYSKQKIKKANSSINLNLTLNPDIISYIKSKYSKLFVVGFAAETENLIDNAKIKLQKKGLDMVVANNVSNGQVFNQDMSQVVIIDKELNQIFSRYDSKLVLAGFILEHISKLI